jgi:hypothetical protein
MDELDPFFENDTRAAEWRSLRIALMRRLAALQSAQDSTPSPPEQARLEREIGNLKKQIDALLIEEVSQQFVEDSVRVTIAVSHLDRALEEDIDDEQ